MFPLFFVPYILVVDTRGNVRAPPPRGVPGRRSSSTSRVPKRVLDLGCATGTTGAALKQRQDVEVIGIELEPDYAREAATAWTR